LIVVGTLGLLVTEHFGFDSGSMAAYSLWQKVQITLFQSISTRTAGFNTIPLSAAAITDAGLLLMIVLMFIGASPGGTGAAKFGGNYAASLLAQAEAAANGCDQVVWLDAIERRYVEEMGGMNLFFVFGSGGTARLVTPELSGSLLPGITRNSLLQLAGDAGFAVEERKIDVQEWRKGVAAGEITEVFACGTAAVITPVSQVKFGDGEFTVGDGTPGEVTMALRDTLTGIQRGTFADTHGWMARLR